MFLEVCDKHAPVRTRRIRKSKNPWINSYLKDLMHHRDRLKSKAIKSKDSRDWSKFKKTRNRVNTEIRNAKKCYYNVLSTNIPIILVKHDKLLMKELHVWIINPWLMRSILMVVEY